MGKVLDFCNITGESVKEYEGERNYIATGDVVDNKIISFEKVTYKNKPSRANQNVKVGDVLFAKMKDTQKVLIIDEDNAKNIYSTGFLVITPKQDVKSKYLYWLFNSNKFNEQKNKNCKGATQKALNNEGFSKISIKEFPSIKEQEKIVDELDKVQEIIDIRKKQIDDLDELIKSQFVKIFGNPFETTNWGVKKLSEVSISISDGSNIDKKHYYEKGDILFLRIQNVWCNEFRLKDSVYISKNVNKEYIDTCLHTGDLLITKIGRYYTKDSSLGRVSIYLGQDNMANYSNNIMRVRLKDEVNSEFANVLLNLDDYKKYIKRVSVGGTDKRALSKTIIGEFPIIIPPMELQLNFIEFVNKIDKQKDELQKSFEQMEKLQGSLMNKYFSGE